MSIVDVMAWGRALGSVYGTEHRSLLLYSLVRMLRPENVLELGTGLGVSAFCMAQAVRENGRGHVWTVDNGEQWGWASHRQIVEHVSREERFACLRDAPASGVLLERAAELLGVAPWLSLLVGELNLVSPEPVEATSLPFLAGALERPIDLLFADINSRPEACLITLRKYLPLLSEAASVFFDSASSYLPSYLALEQTVDQLNRGKVPAFLLAGCSGAERGRMHELIAERRFSLVHFTEQDKSEQNSVAWLRVEPVNILPYPLTAMRGMLEEASAAIPGESLRQYLHTGDEKVGR